MVCLTWNSAVGVGLVSLVLLVLTHAGYIKYMNRQELVRWADFKLTEAAGMATEYLEIEWNSYLAVLVGGLLLFVAGAVGIELIRCKLLKSKEEVQSVNVKQKFLLRGGSVVVAVLLGIGGTVYTNQFLLI